MNHGMTVRADWPKVIDRIKLICDPDLGQGDEVMDMDEARTDIPVAFFEC